MNSKEYFLNEVIAEASASVGGTIRVLEMGCGTASYVPALLKKYPNVEYVGIDPMEGSFKQAEDLLREVPQASVHYQLGYSNIPECKDNSFDIVVSFSVLEHVKQMDPFMQLANRYLKKGGLMVHRYDLGHALYPVTLKDWLHVTLGNIVPWVLPETKFVRYVPMKEVTGYYKSLLGQSPYRYTYHQMPNQKMLENTLRKNRIVNEELFTEVYHWEFKNAQLIHQVTLPIREKLFPTVAVWGKKTK